jgi:hypothetical protein
VIVEAVRDVNLHDSEAQADGRHGGEGGQRELQQSIHSAAASAAAEWIRQGHRRRIEATDAAAEWIP